MTQPDPTSAIYHLTEEIKRQNKTLENMQNDLSELKTSVAVLESRPGEAINRKKDSTIGGSIGAALITIIYAFYEYIKKV